WDFDVSGRPIQGDCLGERPIRLKAQNAASPARRLRFELDEDPAAYAESAPRLRHPHALDLRGLPPLKLQRTTSNRCGADGCDQHEPPWGRELNSVGRDTHGGIESGFESLIEFSEVRTQAFLRIGGARVHR